MAAPHLPDLENFDEIKSYFEEHCFKPLEAVGTGEKSFISMKKYSEIYLTVYGACTQHPPYNWSKNLYTLVTSRAEVTGMNFTHDEKTRRNYITFLKYVFKYLDRFYVRRLGLAPLEEAIPLALARGEARARARRRWTRVRQFAHLERNSKIQARVDLWLIKHDLSDWVHTKSKCPHIKRARLM